MIVSNASTLILLAKVSILKRFLERYENIVIPKEVEKEIKEGEGFDSKLLKNEMENGRIMIKEVIGDITEILKEFGLHKGEAEAFQLLSEEKGDIILTDDGELIKLCKLFEVPFANSLAVVTRMYEHGDLTKGEALGYLEKLNEYGRYSMEVYNHYRKEVEC